MASEHLHEPAELLSAETIDAHRGYVSLMEELEAIDWYNQRIDAAGDAELARVLTHSRDEEKEHAMMTLEWLRRHDAGLDEQLHTYLFTAEPLPLPEGPAANPGESASAADGTLGIGSLRDTSSPGGGL